MNMSCHRCSGGSLPKTLVIVEGEVGELTDLSRCEGDCRFIDFNIKVPSYRSWLTTIPVPKNVKLLPRQKVRIVVEVVE
jgi:hypothetical protein